MSSDARTASAIQALLLIRTIVVVVGMATFGFGWRGTQMNLVLGLVAGMAALAVAARRHGLDRLSVLAAGYATLGASAALASLASIVLAATNRPYVDATLGAVDHAMFGIAWPDLAMAVARTPAASDLLSFAYSALSWQPFVLLGLLTVTGRGEDGSRFVLAWLIALSVSLAVFPFAPALGGYLHYGLPADAFPHVRVAAAWDFAPIISGARDGTLRLLGMQPVSGLITFPASTPPPRSCWRTAGDACTLARSA